MEKPKREMRSEVVGAVTVGIALIFGLPLGLAGAFWCWGLGARAFWWMVRGF